MLIAINKLILLYNYMMVYMIYDFFMWLICLFKKVYVNYKSFYKYKILQDFIEAKNFNGFPHYALAYDKDQTIFNKNRNSPSLVKY